MQCTLLILAVIVISIVHLHMDLPPGTTQLFNFGLGLGFSMLHAEKRFSACSIEKLGVA